ncbi:DUF4834 family protein [Hymenobacter crusticola]|uniref:DUF4834 domain-containing protein n=1 Tax=Hymenobacter crusticola TaxID=1770526 RepID=A0A243WDP1_9BACT|nr:DUF4834 family protein [Hymenobacter crusticola]OUJ73732.1 hypothetical protein BXP70_12175 [Hymenobacter crusticola]
MVKFLLTLLVISFIIRFVVPVVLRLLVGNLVQKHTRRFEQQFGGSPFNPPPTSPPPGEVRVEYVPPKQKPTPSKEFRGGEYVDYEEVK